MNKWIKNKTRTKQKHFKNLFKNEDFFQARVKLEWTLCDMFFAQESAGGLWMNPKHR